MSLQDFVPAPAPTHHHGHRVRHGRRFWHELRRVNKFFGDPSWLGLAGMVVIIDFVVRSLIEH